MSLSDSEYVTIDKDIRNTGFFSEYLPPCFQLNPKAFLQPPPFECDLIPPYNFNMSRFNQNDARRIISIPEIGAYAVVHAYMKEKHIVKGNRQISRRMDTHGIIVVERFATFHYY